MQVTVKIDSQFSAAKASEIAQGNALWNHPVLLACSGVTFSGFDSVIIPEEDLENTPARGHLIWQEDDPLTGFNGGVFLELGFGGFVEAARIKIKPNVSNLAGYFNYLGTHEVGHTFNLNDCLSTTGCPTWTDTTIMTGHADGITTPASFNTTGPKECDIAKVREIYCAAPSPTPTPELPWPVIPTEPEPCQNEGWFWNFTTQTCNREPQDAQCPHHCIPYSPLEAGACNEAIDYCAFPFGCPPGSVDGGQGCCCLPTPLLIDVSGNGFELTAGNLGIMFDLGGDGRKEPVAWTKHGTDDAWLVLDRNGNGLIDSGKELFGNFTEQPNALGNRNGFEALAEFDRRENGGNGDGLIRENDRGFDSLKLWQDINKNGFSEPSELRTLREFHIDTIELDYKESRRTDQHGNRFKYRAKVKDSRGTHVGRWAWDVILQANVSR